MGLLTILSEEVQDPRRSQGIRTSLPQIFSMIILSNLCGYFGGRPISKFCKTFESTFKEVLELKHEVPSHVIFSDLLNRVDENEIILAFNKWSASYVPLEPGALISGDGKSLRSTVTDGQRSGQRFQAMVSLFCQKSGLVVLIKQYHNSKKSEINVIRHLIDELEGRGLTFFLDALHTQKKQ